MSAKPAFFVALAALLAPLGADGHTSQISPTALVSGAARMASASPPPFLLPQGALTPAFSVALYGLLPSAPHPHPGGAALSVRPFPSGGPPYPYGADPLAGLIDVNGVLYGTTQFGGQYSRGTVFGVTTTGSEGVLHSFGGGVHGNYPVAGLINVDGVLYGTTPSGGGAGGPYNGGLGTVFAIKTTGKETGKETVLHSFGNGSDGAFPQDSLIDVNGVLYGTTSEGGQYGFGTVFGVTTTGSEAVLYSFGASEADGQGPVGGLVNVNGVLYGTTAAGGQYRGGTVFGVTTTGSEGVLHSFGSSSFDGDQPLAGLINVSGELYGTTTSGGPSNYGTVFAVSPVTGREYLLYSFRSGTDGEYPFAGLINVNGLLYGTTQLGGQNGNGTVFSVATNGQELVVYSFGV